MFSKRKMMSRAKDDFFKKPQRGATHRHNAKPRQNRTADEAATRYKSEKFAETPEEGDGEIREVDTRQLMLDRLTEFALGAVAGALGAYLVGQVVGLLFGDAYQVVRPLALYGLLFGGAINVLFLHKAPK